MSSFITGIQRGSPLRHRLTSVSACQFFRNCTLSKFLKNASLLFCEELPWKRSECLVSPDPATEAAFPYTDQYNRMQPTPMKNSVIGEMLNEAAATEQRC